MKRYVILILAVLTSLLVGFGMGVLMIVAARKPAVGIPLILLVFVCAVIISKNKKTRKSNKDTTEIPPIDPAQ